MAVFMSMKDLLIEIHLSIESLTMIITMSKTISVTDKGVLLYIAFN